MNPRPCGQCGEAIVWGKRPGDEVKPVEVDPLGPFILLQDKYLIGSPWRSWADVPSEDKDRIPAEMVEHWKRALDGPRYKIHSVECRRAAAMRLKQKDAVG